MFTVEVAAASDITEIKCTTLKYCQNIFSHTNNMQSTTAFPQCALANRATAFLLKIGDIAWKLQLHCGDHSP
jgi:hypothetical protein